MAIRKSVLITLVGPKSSIIDDQHPLGRSTASPTAKFNSAFSDNTPIARSTLKQEGLTSNLSITQIQGVFKDVTSINDIFTRLVSYFRIFSETVLSSERIAIEAAKTLSDITNFSDQINNAIGKFAQDSVSSTDVGSAIMQNYLLDNTYFLEDYVGQSATF